MSDPDVHGFAIRVPASDAWGEQDFLLASVRRLKSGRDLICRSQGYGTRFSTVVRFDGRDAPFVLWALPLDAVPDDAAMHAGAGEGLRFELLAATADHRRSPHRIAVVSLGTPVSPAVAESLRFDPWHRGGNVAPTGVFNAEPGDVILYPISNGYYVVRVLERTVEPAVLTAADLTPQQLGGKFDLGALILAPYAEQAGVTVNPRLGVWDPLTLQVVPGGSGL